MSDVFATIRLKPQQKRKFEDRDLDYLVHHVDGSIGSYVLSYREH